MIDPRKLFTMPPSPPRQTVQSSSPAWGFFTNHAYVLISILQNPGTPLRVIASRIGITERSVQSVIADLTKAGFLSLTKVGRLNRYTLHRKVALIRELEKHRNTEELVIFLSNSYHRSIEQTADNYNEKMERTRKAKLKVTIR